MSKRLFIIVLGLTAILSANAQLLYKISGKGLRQPSYIIGTYHLANPTFSDSIAGMKDAFKSIEQVYGEVDMTHMYEPANMQKMQKAMMLPDGQTLTSLLSADELQRLNKFLTATMGADLTNPMVASQLNKLTPVTLTTQLELILFLKKNPVAFDPTNTFDGYFQKLAAEQGKGVGGLETIDMQINTLFKSQSLQRQTQLLMCLVDNPDYNELLAERIVRAFYTQNLTEIGKILEEKRHDSCDETPEEREKELDGRNVNWVSKMPTIMAAKPTFFAVGAAHLPGNKGVLELLKKAGYTVEGVK